MSRDFLIAADWSHLNGRSFVIFSFNTRTRIPQVYDRTLRALDAVIYLLISFFAFFPKLRPSSRREICKLIQSNVKSFWVDWDLREKRGCGKGREGMAEIVAGNVSTGKVSALLGNFLELDAREHLFSRGELSRAFGRKVTRGRATRCFKLSCHSVTIPPSPHLPSFSTFDPSLPLFTLD